MRYINSFSYLLTYLLLWLQILHGARRARLEGVELYSMGQQQLARYPVHWHLVGEVYGDVARQLSIHDCFSRCVTLHAAVGLRVRHHAMSKNFILHRLPATGSRSLPAVSYK